MKRYRHLLLLSFLLLAGPLVHAQDLDARSPQPTGTSNKKQREADKKKAKQQKELDKAIKKGRKQHMSYQDKATRKRMKKSKKKAGQWNENRSDFFLTRWFRHKPGKR